MRMTAREIADGELLPKGYGVAWYLPDRMVALVLPIPLNKIAGAFRAWYLEWRRPVENDPIVDAFRKGVERGIQSGVERGRIIGRNETFDELEKLAGIHK